MSGAAWSPRLIAGAAALVMAALPAKEGVRYVAYSDPVGVPTLCMGHTKGVKLGMTATHEQCLAWAGQDVMAALNDVRRCHPELAFTPEQLAAFTDGVFNLGPKLVCDTKNSTMARLLKAGDIEAACREFPKWNKGRVLGVLVALPGLTKRRAHNMAQCLEGSA